MTERKRQLNTRAGQQRQANTMAERKRQANTRAGQQR